jgi:hypothetical protein
LFLDHINDLHDFRIKNLQTYAGVKIMSPAFNICDAVADFENVQPQSLQYELAAD